MPKKDGCVRICGDYKPTVNTQIEVAHHPLPTVELITSKLVETQYSLKLTLRPHSNNLSWMKLAKSFVQLIPIKGYLK